MKITTHNPGILLPMFLLSLFLANTCIAGIYQWTDENGKVHFTDKKPVEDKTTRQIDRHQQGQQPSLKSPVYDHARTLSLAQRSDIQQSVKDIYDTYTHFLGISPSETVRSYTRIFASSGQMAGWCDENGFEGQCADRSQHLDDGKTLAVLYSGSLKKTRKLVMHEAGHVVIPQLSPHLPQWLLEGFSTYFEELDIKGGTSWVRPSTAANHWLKQEIRSNHQLSAGDVISLADEHWHPKTHEKMEGKQHVAWSVVFFLMKDDEGRDLLRHMLSSPGQNSAASITATINDNYPGGMPALEYNWFEWCKTSFSPHSL